MLLVYSGYARSASSVTKQKKRTMREPDHHSFMANSSEYMSLSLAEVGQACFDSECYEDDLHGRGRTYFFSVEEQKYRMTKFFTEGGELGKQFYATLRELLSDLEKDNVFSWGTLARMRRLDPKK